MGNGGFDYIEAGAGNDTIDAGSGDDFILGGTGTDLIRYETSLTGVYVDLTRMDLGETGNFAYSSSTGLDVITGIENVVGSALGDFIYGSSANNTINGGAGDDVLFGFGGDDALTGDRGTDYIVGGAGNDVLTGGNGQDYFYFVSQTDGKDTITDWRASGFDLLIIDEPSFGGGLTPGAYLDASRFVTGTAATQATGQFLWNSATSTLSWDQDGTGAGAAVQIATLTGVSNLTANDILIL
jgi:Ca2+-binding RTX toxin-like protein